MMKRIFSVTNFKIFVKFGCVGVINTIIDTVVFFVLCDVMGMYEVGANVAAYVTSATNSYLMNSRFVYKESKYTLKKYFHFLAGNITVLLISTAALAAFSGFFEVKVIAKLITVPVTVILNFCIQRFIVFKKSADKINDKRC